MSRRSLVLGGAVAVAVLAAAGAGIAVFKGEPPVRTPGAAPSAGCSDAARLQRQIAKAKPGATIALSGPMCLATRIEIDGKKDLTIEGDGTAVLKQAPEATDKMLSVIGSEGVTLRRLEIAGASPSSGNQPGSYSGDTAQSAAVALKGVTRFVMEQTHVHDVYGDFVDIDEGQGGEFSTDIAIRDNQFERSGRQGISTGKNVRNVVISGNTITDVRLAVIDLEPGTSDASTSGVQIINNRADNYRTYFLSVAGVGELSDVLVKGNQSTVAGGKNGGLAFVYVKPRREDRPKVTGFVMCENSGDLVEKNTLAGALDPLTSCS